MPDTDWFAVFVIACNCLHINFGKVYLQQVLLRKMQSVARTILEGDLKKKKKSISCMVMILKTA